MKLGKSWNWVHWLYTSRTGAPTSIVSTMLVTFSLSPDLPFFPPPPNMPETRFFRPPLTVSLAIPVTALIRVCLAASLTPVSADGPAEADLPVTAPRRFVPPFSA